ncbi:MAG: LTA synthase family protein, partial [Candidatus Zixiibacteriota bacterium]
RLRWLTPELRQVAGSVALALAGYSVARVVYFLVNLQYLSAQPAQVIQALLVGIMFDLALVGLLSLPSLLPICLGVAEGTKNWPRSVTFWMFFVPHAAGLTLNLADAVYFKHVFRRQTAELFTIPAEVARMIPDQALASWPLVALLALLIGTFYWLLRKLWRPRSGSNKGNVSWTWRLTLAATVSALALLAVRGGLQDRPLRPGMAFFSENIALGQLALNSLYSALWSYNHRAGRRLSLMPPEEALPIAREMVSTNSSSFYDDEFPFMRRDEPPENDRFEVDSGAGLNVVILIFESWNAMLSESISGKPGVTPVFDSLASEGLLFTNFCACGDRSIQAFPAILAGLPDLTGGALLNSTLELNTIRGLGSILSERGYGSLFAMGAPPTAMGFDSYSRAAGFTEQLSARDFPDEGPENLDELWGVYDEPFLRFFARSLREKREPYVAAFFSLSAHAPYRVPPSFANERPLAQYSASGEAPEPRSREGAVTRQLRAQAYSDFALGGFISAARMNPDFERTIFVITADHVGWSGGVWNYSEIQRFQIPLLIYAPSLVQAGRDSRPASQADILPSVLDILNCGASHASFGGTLFSARKHRFAIFSRGASFGFINDSLFLLATEDSALGLFEYPGDPHLERNLVADSESGPVKQQIMLEFGSYLQTGMNALVDNRIYPLNGS